MFNIIKISELLLWDVSGRTQVLSEQPGEHRVSVGDEALHLLLLLVLQTEKHRDGLLPLPRRLRYSVNV